MKKTYLLIGVLIIIVAAIVYLESLKPNIPITNIFSSNGNAPELSGISGYINSNSNLTIKSLQGKVVIVDFWTYSCINCLRTLPYLNSWYEKYHDKGFEIIGVHTPEFNFEKDYNNVQMAVEKYSIKYPVVLDNDYATWNAYQNQYWPRKYFLDKNGNIRFDHIGEGGYDEEELEIQQLLSENSTAINMQLSNISDTTPTTDNSPETYLGWQFAISRNENIGAEGFKPDQNFTYAKPSSISENKAYLENTWYNKEDALVSFNNSIMYYKFRAKNANIVLEGNGTVQVFLDDKPISSNIAGKDIQYISGQSYMNITEPRLYDIYDGEYSAHILKLEFTQDIQAHAFTFG